MPLPTSASPPASSRRAAMPRRNRPTAGTSATSPRMPSRASTSPVSCAAAAGSTRRSQEHQAALDLRIERPEEVLSNMAVIQTELRRDAAAKLLLERALAANPDPHAGAVQPRAALRGVRRPAARPAPCTGRSSRSIPPGTTRWCASPMPRRVRDPDGDIVQAAAARAAALEPRAAGARKPALRARQGARRLRALRRGVRAVRRWATA